MSERADHSYCDWDEECDGGVNLHQEVERLEKALSTTQVTMRSLSDQLDWQRAELAALRKVRISAERVRDSLDSAEQILVSASVQNEAAPYAEAYGYARTFRDELGEALTACPKGDL